MIYWVCEYKNGRIAVKDFKDEKQVDTFMETKSMVDFGLMCGKNKRDAIKNYKKELAIK